MAMCRNRLPHGLLVALLCGSVGCFGGAVRPKTVPVSGKVTWNGQPLTKGTISFVPTSDAQTFPASGEIDSGGNYKLKTFQPGDGAMPGEYRIAVMVMEGADPAAKKEGTRVLPDKYYRAEKSGLTASIKAGDSAKTFDFALDGKR